MLVKDLKYFHDFLVSNRFLFLTISAQLQNNFLVDTFWSSSIVLTQIFIYPLEI